MPRPTLGPSKRLGPKALVDMVLLVGLYSATCALINAFGAPVPVGIAEPPPENGR